MRTRQSRRFHCQNPNRSIRAVNVASGTRPHRTYRGTSRRTAVWIRCRPSGAASAARRTCPCRLWPCTCSRINCHTCAASAGSCFRDHGYCKAICVLTREKSLMAARTAAKLLRIDRICAHTCRRTRRTKISSALDVTRRLRSRATSTNTKSRRACATTKMNRRRQSRPRPSPRPARATQADATRDRNHRRMVYT